MSARAHRIPLIYDVNTELDVPDDFVYQAQVAATSPIPVRLDAATIRRLDAAALALGNTRAGVIKLCLSSFLDAFEKTGMASLPLEWKSVLDRLDGRTIASRISKSEQHIDVEAVIPVLPHNAGGDSESAVVSPLTQVGPPKDQMCELEEARLASLEARLPPGVLAAVLEAAEIEMTNRMLNTRRSAESSGKGAARPPQGPASDHQEDHDNREANTGFGKA